MKGHICQRDFMLNFNDGNVDSCIYANMAHISICQKYANSAVTTYMPSSIREHLLAYINAKNDVPLCTLTVFAYEIEHV